MSKRDDKLDEILGVKGVAEKIRQLPKDLAKTLDEAGLVHKSADKPDAEDEAHVETEKAAPPPTPPAQGEQPAQQPPAQEQGEVAQVVDIVMQVLTANNGQPAETIKAALVTALAAALDTEDAPADSQPPPAAAKAFAQTDEVGKVDPVIAAKELTTLTTELTDTQAVIVEAQKGIEETQQTTIDALKQLKEVLAPIADLVKAVEGVNTRLGVVEKHLGGRPRIASQDPVTELDPESELAKESKAALEEFDNVLGLKLKPTKN